MKRLSITLLMLVALWSAAQAQVPGYLGKKAYFVVDLNPTPAMINMNVNNATTVIVGDESRNDKQSLTALNYRPQASLEYLIGQHTALGVNYSMLQTGTMRSDIDMFGENGEPDVLRGTSIGINLRMFEKGRAIAPIGNYQNIGVEYTTVNSYDDKDATEAIFAKDFNHYVVSYGVGKQKVIAKTLVFRVGLEVAYTFVPKAAFERVFDGPALEEANYNVHRSMFGYYVFSIKLGLGSLLF